MKINKREEKAIVGFLEFLDDNRRAHEIRDRLFRRVAENPELVIKYLGSLPRGVEAGNRLLRDLRLAAQLALKGTKGV